MKNKGQSVPREGKDMSNFNDLYDHVAADRTRAIQLLGIQDIRRKAIAELLAANAYTEPANIDAMTEQERRGRLCARPPAHPRGRAGARAEQRRDLCHGRRRHERAPQLHRAVHPDKA